jgi:hypothetical protein
MYVMEVALAAKSKFNFNTIGKSEENKVGIATMKVFQEHRLTQLSNKSLAPGKEVLVCLIYGDQVEVKVGVGIIRVPGIGSAEKSGHNLLICLASCYKAVHDDLVVLR